MEEGSNFKILRKKNYTVTRGQNLKDKVLDTVGRLGFKGRVTASSLQVGGKMKGEFSISRFVPGSLKMPVLEHSISSLKSKSMATRGLRGARFKLEVRLEG